MIEYIPGGAVHNQRSESYEPAHHSRLITDLRHNREPGTSQSHPEPLQTVHLSLPLFIFMALIKIQYAKQWWCCLQTLSPEWVPDTLLSTVTLSLESTQSNSAGGTKSTDSDVEPVLWETSFGNPGSSTNNNGFDTS